MYRLKIRFGYILLNLVCPLIGSDKIIVFFVRPRRRKNIDFVCARLNTIKDTVISDNVLKRDALFPYLIKEGLMLI